MTEQDSQRLREHLAAAETSAAGDCADPEELWAASRGELTAERTRELLNHSLRCSSCAEAWRIARDIGDELPATTVVTTPKRVSTARWLGFGSLAAVAAAAGVFLLVSRLGDSPTVPPPTVFRDDGRLRIATLIPEDIPLSRDDATLRWSAGPEGSLYDIEVVDERLDLLRVQRDLTVNEFTVPPTALSGLTGGAPVLWRVELVLPDGRRVISPTFIHRLE